MAAQDGRFACRTPEISPRRWKDSPNVNAAPLIWLLLLFAAFYLLVLRPARSRQRQALVVQASLQPGLEVMTTAGLFATIAAVEDDVVVLEVAPGVRSRYAKGAIAKVITPDEPAESSASSAASSAEDPADVESAGLRTDETDEKA